MRPGCLIILSRRWRYSILNINRMKYFLLFAFLVSFINCSQLSIKEEKDNLGRVVRSVSYISGEPDTIEIIRYIGKTNKVLTKEFIKLKNGFQVYNWTEAFTYNKGRISQINYFINLNERKFKSGNINFKYFL